MENEKDVYLRLGYDDGLVHCINASEHGLELELMKTGSLAPYLELQQPAEYLISRCVLQMVKTLFHAHSNCGILATITSRNVLLHDKLSAKLCDFNDSAAMPRGSDISQAEQNGLSVQTDIFQVGSLMYEILERDPFKYDLLANEDAQVLRLETGDQHWQVTVIYPRPGLLPSTEHLQLGHIIRNC